MRFEDGIWEAHLIDDGARGELWKLVPWPENEVLRHCVDFEPGVLAELARSKEREKSHDRVGWVLLVLMPLTGLLPAALQEDIEVTWGLSAWKATLLSAVPGLGAILISVGVYFGDWKPPLPVPLVFLLCVYFFTESMFRMNYSFTMHAPMGSIVTWPLKFTKRARNHAPKPRPSGAPSGIFDAMLRCVLLGFAPRSIQEELVEELGLPERWLSFLSSVAELIGGIVNLRGAGGGGLFRLLAVFFLIEGAGRLIFVWMTGRPVGSLLGLPLTPLYRKWSRRRRLPGSVEDP